MKASRMGTPFEYVLKSERKEKTTKGKTTYKRDDDCTVFTLRGLTPLENATAINYRQEEGHGSYLYYTCKCGVEGWKNLKDHTGKGTIEFEPDVNEKQYASDESLDAIKGVWGELAIAIMLETSIEGDDQKN